MQMDFYENESLITPLGEPRKAGTFLLILGGKVRVSNLPPPAPTPKGGLQPPIVTPPPPPETTLLLLPPNLTQVLSDAAREYVPGIESNSPVGFQVKQWTIWAIQFPSPAAPPSARTGLYSNDPNFQADHSRNIQLMPGVDPAGATLQSLFGGVMFTFNAPIAAIDIAYVITLLGSLRQLWSTTDPNF